LAFVFTFFLFCNIYNNINKNNNNINNNNTNNNKSNTTPLKQMVNMQDIPYTHSPTAQHLHKMLCKPHQLPGDVRS